MTDVVVEPRHPEGGLVTGPQVRLVGAHVEFLREAVQPACHCLAAAESGHQAGDVMRHPPDVLLSVALVKTFLAEARTGLHDGRALTEGPGCAAGRDVTRAGIKKVLPVLRPVLEFGRGRTVSERFGEPGDREVIDRPLQRDRCAGAEYGLGCVAQLQISGDARPLHVAVEPDTAPGRRVHHVAQCRFEIEVLGAVRVEVHDQRHHTVAAHLAGRGIRKRPARIRSTLLGVVDQRLGHIARLLWEKHCL